MMFHPGQLVLCVDDAPEVSTDPHVELVMDGLRKGRIFRWSGEFRGRDNGVAACVRLVEITGRKRDLPYFASRFRSVDDRRIAVFRELLKDRLPA